MCYEDIVLEVAIEVETKRPPLIPIPMEKLPHEEFKSLDELDAFKIKFVIDVVNLMNSSWHIKFKGDDVVRTMTAGQKTINKIQDAAALRREL
jgi:hypothetical protein